MAVRWSCPSQARGRRALVLFDEPAPASVPLTVLAFYVDQALLKVLFGVLAFACLYTASYSVWRTGDAP